MAAEFTITGLDRLVYKFRQLPKRIGDNAAHRALAAGANVIRDEARLNAAKLDDPQTPENIAKNIVTQKGSAKRGRQAGGLIRRIGVLGGAKAKKGGGTYFVGGSSSNPGGDTFYWRFLEFGTSKMAARPFMRPAMNSKAGEAFAATAASMERGFDEEMRKLGMGP